MKRVPRLTRRSLRNADRLSVVPGSVRGRAVGRIIAGLTTDDVLPAPGDVRALVPPTTTAFVRRVPGRNLWLWYVLSEDRVAVIALTGPRSIRLRRGRMVTDRATGGHLDQSPPVRATT